MKRKFVLSGLLVGALCLLISAMAFGAKRA